MAEVYTKKRVVDGEIILERTTTDKGEIPKRVKLDQIDEDILVMEGSIDRLQVELSEARALKITITGIR